MGKITVLKDGGGIAGLYVIEQYRCIKILTEALIVSLTMKEAIIPFSGYCILQIFVGIVGLNVVK